MLHLGGVELQAGLKCKRLGSESGPAILTRCSRKWRRLLTYM